jgi:hypothetical protein
MSDSFTTIINMSRRDTITQKEQDSFIREKRRKQIKLVSDIILDYSEYRRLSSPDITLKQIDLQSFWYYIQWQYSLTSTDQITYFDEYED